MEEKIKVARYRNSEYILNFLKNNGADRYVWSPSKGKKFQVHELPKEVVDYLLMNSSCFRDGELVIIEDTDLAKESVEAIDELESYKNNSHSKEDVIKLLEGNLNKMKSELNKITSVQEKNFIIDIAKEIKLDSNAKLTFLAEWMNIPVDILFAEDKEDEVK